jgi:tRNA pseudouridine38-40 synthase
MSGVSPLPNFKLVLEYDGTAYSGYQYQPDLPTIQGSLQDALAKLVTPGSPVYAAGRTDAGVHARGQVVSFLGATTIPAERLAAAVNALLPRDIAVQSAEVVSDRFNARHDALSRVYRYYILNRSAPSALLRLYSFHLRQPLDLAAMEEALQSIMGVHDFRAMSCPETGKSAMREVTEAEFLRLEGGLLALRVVANAFVYRMMRILAGSLVQVGLHRWSVERFGEALASCAPGMAGPALPARGLVLERVTYREEGAPAE